MFCDGKLCLPFFNNVQAVGVPFSYTLELPGMGYGFQIPVRFVNQVNMETWEGIAASARIAKIYYRARDQK